ncbi:hypothetical protein TNIN_350171 [Trichonephila inaurata madagascariensis]|uniref:Uncharacterized protein n=1 Tax=Trichonephila inaurata madagascariensis TaxID=2747483 RepID=A0A8X6YRT7_9ARAC|nr:hypothetical protein TNIN_350171 [Trichonephila inaurata madagascariensis]
MVLGVEIKERPQAGVSLGTNFYTSAPDGGIHCRKLNGFCFMKTIFFQPNDAQHGWDRSSTSILRKIWFIFPDKPSLSLSLSLSLGR